MKKRFIALLLSGIVSFSVPVYADFDYSILDNMSKEELEELQEKVSDRITELKQLDMSTDTESTGIWTVKYFVDEFDQPTDDGYVSTSDLLEGVFSNTATTNSLLYVSPIFDERAAFKLLEYGNNIVKGYHSSGTQYDFTILTPSNSKVSMTGMLKDGSDRVFLNEQYVPYFYDILNENGTVKISIVEHDRPSTKYLFEITDSSFFNNAYLQIFDSVPHHNYGTADEIEPEFSVSARLNDHYPIIDVTTNLPNGTRIIINTSTDFGKEYSDQAACEVLEGSCTAELTEFFPTYKKVLCVEVAIAAKQSEDFFEAYGDDFEKIKGDFSKTFSFELQ